MTDTLPALTGTAKQVAWAASIRTDLLRRLDVAIETISVAPGFDRLSPAAVAEINAQAGAYRAEIAAQAGAGWWIDNRDMLPVAAAPAANVGRLIRALHQAGRLPVTAAEMTARTTA